jgi:hypothetical protein
MYNLAFPPSALELIRPAVCKAPTILKANDEAAAIDIFTIISSTIAMPLKMRAPKINPIMYFFTVNIIPPNLMCKYYIDITLIIPLYKTSA